MLNPTHNVSGRDELDNRVLTGLQITEAIRRYGVSETSTDVIVVRVDSPDITPDEMQRKMETVLEATISPFSGLEAITDWASIKKVCLVYIAWSLFNSRCSITS